MTNRPSYDHSWPTMPCLWCWTNSRKQPFARITERKREALIKRQQQLSPQFSAQYEKEPVSIHRAAERGVERQWKGVRRASFGGRSMLQPVENVTSFCGNFHCSPRLSLHTPKATVYCMYYFTCEKRHPAGHEHQASCFVP